MSASDSGRPMPAEVEVATTVGYHQFETHTGYVTLQNVGCNTVWLSLDQRSWYHVMSGTSWDLGINVRGFFHCTQTGRTRLAVIGLQRNLIPTQSRPIARAPEIVP
jgi:hypothetical protein